MDFHTYNDDLNDDSVLHIFVTNRSNDSSGSVGASTYVANLQSYQDHDADWFSKNPYLGCAINASEGQGFGNNSTHRVYIRLRSRPIPLEELLLPAVNIHILAKDSDTWKFDYTMTITLDDGTVLPPFSSNIEGLTGLVLDQDNRNYYGICSEVQPIPPRTIPVTDSVLTGVTIEFNTHDDDKNNDTGLGIHIVNRLSATASQDISVVNNVAPGRDVPRFRRYLQTLRSSARLQCHFPAGHGPADRLHQHRRRHGPVDLRLPRDVLLRPGPALFVDGVRGRARSGSSQAHGGLQRTRLSHALLSVPAAELRTGPASTRRSRSTSSGRSSRNCSTAGRRSGARIRSSRSSSTARLNSATPYRRRSWISSSSSTILRPRTHRFSVLASRWVRPTRTTCPSWDSSPRGSGSGFTSTTSTSSPSLSASTRATARHRSRWIFSSRRAVRRRSPGPLPSTSPSSRSGSGSPSATTSRPMPSTSWAGWTTSTASRTRSNRTVLATR